MSEYLPIPVSAARAIANEYRKNWVVILAYNAEHNLTHTVTYGISPLDKVTAARYGEIAAKAIGCDTSKKDFNEDFRRDLDAAKQAMLGEACELSLAAIYDPKLMPEAVKKLKEALAA